MSTRRAESARIQLAMRHVIARTILRNDAISREAGLNLADAQVLHLIQLSGRPMTPGDIRASTGLPSSTTTRVVDRLVAQGYVTREPDEVDRRRVVISIVPARLAELGARYARYAHLLTEVEAGFSVAELGVIARYLEELAAAE